MLHHCVRIASALAFVAGAWILGLTQASAAEKISFAHVSTIGSEEHLAGLEFGKVLKEKSNGALEVEIFPNAQLGGEKEIVEGMLLGTVDVGKPSAAVLANWVTEFNVINMPFVFKDLQHLQRAADPSGPIFKKLTELSAAKGIRMLGIMVCCTRHIMTKKPVNSIADMRGIKIRAIQNPVHVATFNAFGANATAIAYPEVYGALQTGVVDGADAGNLNYFEQKFYEQAPHWTLVGWLIFANPLIMSESRFSSLSPEHQRAVLEAGTAATKFQVQQVIDNEDKRLDDLINVGVKVTRPDRAPFIAASKKVYDEFLKTPTEFEILEMIRKVD